MGWGKAAEALHRADDESILDWRSPEGPAVQRVRSTLLASSLRTLKDHGHYETYLAHLPQRYHEPILLTLAPVWHPLDVAMAHYAACDAIGIGEEELREIGEAVAQSVMGTFLGTLVRSTRGAGTTPWIPLKNYDKLWARLMLGGHLRIVRTGPKDARIISEGIPMFAHNYYRVAYAGVVKGSLGLFARTIYAKSKLVSPTRLDVIVSWV